MGQPTNLFRHSLREGWADLWEWAGEHIPTTAVGLLAALLGIPAYLRFTGVSMTALRDQLAQVAAYSLVGPLALIIVAYVYFCLRAPSKLYAQRTDELRDLRVQLGRSIDDLGEPPPKNRIGQFLVRHSLKGTLAVIIILIFVCVRLFGSVDNLTRANAAHQMIEKANMLTMKVWVMIVSSTADQAVAICDEQKSKTKKCNDMRVFAKTISAQKRKLTGQIDQALHGWPKSATPRHKSR
jgi:hypothetical protein